MVYLAVSLKIGYFPLVLLIGVGMFPSPLLADEVDFTNDFLGIASVSSLILHMWYYSVSWLKWCGSETWIGIYCGIYCVIILCKMSRFSNVSWFSTLFQSKIFPTCKNLFLSLVDCAGNRFRLYKLRLDYRFFSLYIYHLHNNITILELYCIIQLYNNVFILKIVYFLICSHPADIFYIKKIKIKNK